MLKWNIRLEAKFISTLLLCSNSHPEVTYHFAAQRSFITTLSTRPQIFNLWLYADDVVMQNLK